ncbi:putative mitochondrial protein, partial [Mucuna pruriens]
MTRSEADHSVFYCHSTFSKCVYLVVYVDDIVITGNDDIKIFHLKQFLFIHFQTKDLDHLKYFLDIEVAQSKEGIVISQRKYALDILQETSMSNCRPVDSPMDSNMKLMVKHGEPYSDPGRYRRYRRLVELIYLTMTRPRPDISFAVGVVIQFMQEAPCVDHWAIVLRILRYIKKTLGHRVYYMRIREIPLYQVIVMLIGRSTIGFCILIGGNVVSWKSKKQNTVARSSADGKYWVMTSATCELIWEKLLAKEISIEFVNSSNQLADIFTKSLRGPSIQVICSKLGAYNLYALA